MKRALRCLGCILLGIGAVTCAAVVLLTLVGALFWSAAALASYFELPALYSILFYVGIIVIGAGVVVGVALCRESTT